MTPELENAVRAQARRCAEEITKAMSVKPKPKWNAVCPPHPSQALREGPAYGRQLSQICQCYWAHEQKVWSGIMSKYPRVGSVAAKSKNTSAKCKCGAVAKFKTTVEVNVFRGDDEVVWSCNEHKKDCSFLVDWQGGAA